MLPTLVSDASKPKHSAILAPEELAPFFPQYEILRMLGRGGMGAVYLARQISLNRLVAIKILPADLGESDMGFAERFKNEAQAMAQLSHACIVAVYDFGQTTNGLLYIVMEYIEGTDVQLMLASQGRLHSAHAMAITAHVCDALQYAHSCGIIHRDIKPSNIMVGNNGVVKVADFGLAKMSQGQTTGLTQSGMAMGTLHFMAPETLTLGSAVDQRADIYAVGVMLYQMLTGKLPQGMFEMPSFQVPGLDPRYDRIVAKALRDDREVRYQAAADLRHDLDAILTQPVEKVAPEAAEVKALPPVEQRGKKKARVPSLPPQPATPAAAAKKPVGLILTALGVAAVIVAAFVYFRDHGVGPITQPALATKDQPFTNTLGMKFVPVPITGGPTDGKRVLFCAHETRNADYAAFAAENPSLDDRWRHPRAYEASMNTDGNYPVVMVSWDAANAFCRWLSKKEGRTYRLPTDHEWSCAVGIGEMEDPNASPASNRNKSPGIYPWGGQWPPPPGVGNLPDKTWEEAFHQAAATPGYTDDYPTTAPVMSFKSNSFGIHDLTGNVQEWCSDWFDAQHAQRVARGGSWNNGRPAGDLLAGYRQQIDHPENGFINLGFRCVLEVESKDASFSPSPPVARSLTISATKDAPFTNTLGMKFVPVPITGGPTNGKRVLFSIWETRIQDYEVFVKETKREWPKPNFGQETSHPVVNMSWNDAQAFCRWLTEREQKAGRIAASVHYRLPHDHEWSCAVGIGDREDPMKTPAQKNNQIMDLFPWGAVWPPPPGTGNYADESAKISMNKSAGDYFAGYNDGHTWTAPVGSFPANRFGLFDLSGNAHELSEDEWQPGQNYRTGRGGSFDMAQRTLLQSSNRSNDPPDKRIWNRGFRCVLESSVTSVYPSPRLTVSASPPATATKDAPFINTLGMKFVPVPGTDALMCIHETRRKDYATYAAGSPGADGSWKDENAGGFTLTGNVEDHPVMKVSLEDAQKFCAWLSQKEGKTYRLPTDQEWSIAAGIGQDEKWQQDTTPATVFKNQTDFPWGTQWPPPKGSGNFSDLTRKTKVPDSTPYYLHDYEDGFPTTAPVMSFQPNEIGLYDLSGNVCEWCADWYDTSAKERVLRGGSWNDNDRIYLLSSYRGHSVPDSHNGPNGFRVVLVPPVPPAATEAPRLKVSSSPTSASKESPFINTLGMKFVPVPITGGPTSGQRVLFSTWETRVQDFEAFAKDAGHPWRAEAKALATHPAAVNWRDIAPFCQWLTEHERKLGIIPANLRYRVTTDHEWSCAVGIGDQESADGSPLPGGAPIQMTYPWGNTWPPPPEAGNFKGEEASGRPGNPVVKGFRDGFLDFAPAGSFPANVFGLFDLGGNAWELCEREIDSTSGPVFIRGGSSANSHPNDLTSSRRVSKDRDDRAGYYGFRIVLAPAPSTPATATKDSPFTNSLGMKFAPLPGTKTLMSIHETRNADYAAFATAVPAAGSGWRRAAGADSHPVVSVSWEEAAAFCAWLSQKENRRYRLPKDREWSIAVQIDTREAAAATPQKLGGALPGVYPWGAQWPPPGKAGNYAGSTDGFTTTAPVMSFAPNALGFFDLGGNVWEYCSDGFNESGQTRVLRGASWSDAEQAALLSSCRDPIDPSARSGFVGFRCVLDDSEP